MTMHSALAAVARMEDKGLVHCDFGAPKQLAFSLQPGARLRVFVTDVGETRQRSHGSYPSGSRCATCTATCRENWNVPGAKEESSICVGGPKPFNTTDHRHATGTAESCTEEMYDKQMLSAEEAAGPGHRLQFRRTRSMVVKLAIGTLDGVIRHVEGAGATEFKVAAMPVLVRLRDRHMSAAEGMAAVLEMGAKFGSSISAKNGTVATVAECIASHASDFDRLIERVAHSKPTCPEGGKAVGCIDGVGTEWMLSREISLVRQLMTKRSRVTDGRAADAVRTISMMPYDMWNK